MPASPSSRSPAARAGRLVWRLIVTTVGSCMRYRVTGLAAEAAFFAVLSMPPLVFALTGAIGYVTAQFPAAQVEDVRQAVIDVASRGLTEDAVNGIIVRTMDDVLAGGRFDVISVGFVLALWSGSRALNVFIDTISIMHGLGGHRGIVRTRALSFGLYLLGLVLGVVLIPLVVAGPRLVDRLLPARVALLNAFYWPVVVVGCICFLATLYHVSVPVRTKWSFNLPGATFSMVTWIVGSYVLRWTLTVTAGESKSIFGPLAAPIAVLLWLYVVALAVLIGAGVNAAFDAVFPQNATQRAREEVMSRFRSRWHDRSDLRGEATTPTVTDGASVIEPMSAGGAEAGAEPSSPGKSSQGKSSPGTSSPGEQAAGKQNRGEPPRGPAAVTEDAAAAPISRASRGR